MPRTQLSMRSDIKRYLEMEIRQAMKELHISQNAIGKLLGISGAGVSIKIKRCQWTYDQLVILMEALKFPPEKILYFMSGGRFRKTA